MEYINPPQKINYKEILEKSFCFAPSKYSKFNPKKNPKNIIFETFGNLIKCSEERMDINPKEKYFYIEIGNINVNNGGIDLNQKIGLRIPQKRPLIVKKGYILISKVRTYRKGIGYVNSNEENLICTSGFIVIRTVRKDITREFLYSILRHNFFIEQILSLQNRGMYPRLDNTTKEEVLIPIPKDKKIILEMTNLTKRIIENENRIKINFIQINNIIEKEINENQKKEKFQYSLPNYNEINEELRISSSIYSEEYKSLMFLIKNYERGFFNVDEEDIMSGSTPKERIFGKGKVWVTPTNITKHGTLNPEKIICRKYNLSKDSLLIVNRGREEDVGVCMFYDYNLFGEGQHNQGIYRIEKFNKKDLVLMACLMNSKIYRRICANLSLGSKMDEMKTKHFSMLPFPKFPKEIREKIFSLYYEGIIKLNKEIVENQNKLNKIIDNLVKDMN